MVEPVTQQGICHNIRLSQNKNLNFTSLNKTNFGINLRYIYPGNDPVQVGRGSADIGVPAPLSAHRRAHLPPRHGHRPPQQEAIHSKVGSPLLDGKI